MTDERSTILFVHAADEWYGSDYVLYEIVRSLEGSEFTPLVVLPDDVISEIPPEHRLSGRLRKLGIAVHHLPVAVLRRKYMTPIGALRLAHRSRLARRKILECVSGAKIALVHTHTAGVMSGALVARKLGVPHLWHVSEIVTRPRLVGQMLARRITRDADSIVTVSAAVRDHLLRAQPSAEHKTRVIYNAIDTRRFEGVDARAMRARFSPDGCIVIGMVGRVGMSKGQELFLEAMRDVVRYVPKVRIALVGGVLDGNVAALDELRALAVQCGLAQRTVVDGYCDDVPACLAAMDIVVQPSLRPDSLPTTVLEAMASGKPVIAAANGGSPEMVVDGETGLLFPTGNASALSAAIQRLLANAPLREQMGIAGRERVKRKFGPEEFSAAYLRQYRALRSQRP